ncbi:hypothetical protein BGX29_010704 [Mortierella sp. GBA35]|nr:hypothetical protein BGX29_010704 [Mortierella sp. GBA35]
MTRSLSSIILFAAVAALAMVSYTVEAQASKPECAPIHTLYKNMTNTCTQNGKAIPNSDSDKAWLPCICLNGFYHVAVAAEKCALAGSAQPPQITAPSLDALCVGYPNYVAADKQTAPDTLAPALVSATSLSAALPTATPTAGPGGNTGTDEKSAAMGRMDSSRSSFVIMVGMTGFAAVVLATAAAF